MDKAELAQTVANELRACGGKLAAAMNNLAGPYGTQYRSCIPDLYFACYHMATALLAARGIRARSHEATQELLSLHFVKPAAMLADTSKRFNELMDKRHTADYRTYIAVDENDVAEFRPWVSDFLKGGLRLLGKSVSPEQAKGLEKMLRQFDEIHLGAGTQGNAPRPRAKGRPNRSG